MRESHEIDLLTEKIIGAAIRVHRKAGPRALESTYEQMMEIALRNDGVQFSRQVPIDLEFEGHIVRNAYRMDMLVEARVVVELKSVEKLTPIHFKQVGTYLRHTGFEVGLLLNFQELKMIDGIHRLVNNYKPTDQSQLRINRLT